MADDDALIAYRLNIPINELTPADRERYASMRSRMVPRRVAERQQMLREREAQRRQSRANDPERDALIAYRLGIPANELTDADRARYESQRGGSLFGRSTPQAQPQPRSPFRQAIDTTVRNLGAVGGIMNPALPGQLERQLIGRETPQAAVPARPQQNAPMPRSRQPMAATTMPAERQAAQAMMMEANQPAGAGQAAPPPRPARRSRPMSQRRPRETSADDLNAISLAFARGERPRGGAADTIGKA